MKVTLTEPFVVSGSISFPLPSKIVISKVYEAAIFLSLSRTSSIASSTLFSSLIVTFLAVTIAPSGNTPSSAVTVIVTPSTVTD